MTVTVRTGGKLYLAGEYSVLTPGQTALIKDVPIYMVATVKASEVIQLQSDMFNYAIGMSDDDNYRLIQESIRTFEAFYEQELTPFSLSITGKLEKDGLKFGIGSSGSVTVLTIKALAKYFGLDLSADQLFKLSSYTLLKLGDNGSMGDIACISYGDFVAYKSFDRQKLADQIKTSSLSELLSQDWGYEIDIIKPRLSADFLVGWTRQPAISKDLIDQVKSAISPTFLQKTEKQVQSCKMALAAGNKKHVIASLQAVSDLLASLSSSIYIDKLQKLKEAAAGVDVVAKSSGAGGGDCGIALVFSNKDKHELIKRWQEAGIEVLYQERWHHD